MMRFRLAGLVLALLPFGAHGQAPLPTVPPAGVQAPSPSLPPAAQDSPPPAVAPAPAPEVSLVDMIRALSQFLDEEEIQLVYDYLWDASIAALKGEEAEVVIPPELAFKLAILQKRIVKEGGHYLEGLARQMDKDLRDWRDQLLTPPPPAPYPPPAESTPNRP
ncbi:MAG: hypothetical protein ACOZB0_04240 [Pseudomonadota bacterium]